jgi:hypothetical protein
MFLAFRHFRMRAESENASVSVLTADGGRGSDHDSMTAYHPVFSRESAFPDSMHHGETIGSSRSSALTKAGGGEPKDISSS